MQLQSWCKSFNAHDPHTWENEFSAVVGLAVLFGKDMQRLLWVAQAKGPRKKTKQSNPSRHKEPTPKPNPWKWERHPRTKKPNQRKQTLANAPSPKRTHETHNKENPKPPKKPYRPGPKTGSLTSPAEDPGAEAAEGGAAGGEPGDGGS